MNRLKPILITILAALLLGVIVWPASAQTPSLIHAEVDRTSLSTDEVLVLTVRIDASSGLTASPVMPALDGF